MNSILENLFKGKTDIPEPLTFKKRAHSPDEKLFIDTLSTEQQEIYEQMCKLNIKRRSLENQDCFVAGFRMAVNTILELLTNTDDS